jgi:hypothetical protein
VVRHLPIHQAILAPASRGSSSASCSASAERVNLEFFDPGVEAFVFTFG